MVESRDGVTPKRVLHCHSSFSPGGKELRTVALINAFGPSARHVIWTAKDASCTAAAALAPDIDIAFADDAPPINGAPSLTRYRAIAAYLQGFDLVLTYNWGAMDVVAARRLFPAHMPPLIHHEDGFEVQEAQRRKLGRSLVRRALLPAADQVIVPSTCLAHIAREDWGQRAGRVRLIRNGVDLSQFHPRAARMSQGPITIGAVGALRPEKNFARLIHAFAAGPEAARLVILGDGPERAALKALAQSLGVADRVSLLGHQTAIAEALHQIDIFASASDTEQAPLSLIEAMATGLPVLATDVGDVRAMVSVENQSFVVNPRDRRGYQEQLAALIADADMRAKLGRANRLRAEAQFDVRSMIRHYANAYGLPDPTAP